MNYSKKYSTYFKDKIVVVTGAGRGLGHALALELAGQGAVVVNIEINVDLARECQRLIERFGQQSYFYIVDVTERESMQKTISEIRNRFGRIDLLINNAGMNLTGETRDLTLSHWHEVISLNLLGVVNGAGSVYPIMARQGFGQIVNIASMAGLAPLPLVAPYVASKFGVVGLSEVMRMEGKDLGVKVTAVCPGRLDTTLLDQSEVIGVDRTEFIKKVPLKIYPMQNAVRKILNGIITNRKLVIFPRYVKLLWFAHRYFPGLLQPFYRHSLSQFRILRD